MEAETITELGNVVVARLAGIVGYMKGNAKIEAQDKKLQVVTQTDTRSCGQLLEEGCWLEL